MSPISTALLCDVDSDEGAGTMRALARSAVGRMSTPLQK